MSDEQPGPATAGAEGEGNTTGMPNPANEQLETSATQDENEESKWLYIT